MSKFLMTLEIIVAIISNYFFLLSLFGIYRNSKRIRDVKPSIRFAAIVAAHNEEQVISGIIDSLKNVDYPKELMDIFIIADNCSDDTARIAREMGANVYERLDTSIKGKGYALKWMFEKIYEMEKKYDAVAIFDADNLVSKDFFIEMNAKFIQGSKAVQGYIDSKNPNDTWITATYSIAFWAANRFFQLARQNARLSCQLNGTGFCVDINLLREIGWEVDNLVEDLELTCRMVLRGYKVDWSYDAVVYDEKPLRLMESLRQRKRWMQGYADLFSKYFFKLLKKSIKSLDFKAFDCAMYIFQPFTVLLVAFVTLLSLGAPSSAGIEATVNVNFMDILLKILGILQFIYTPLILVMDKKVNWKIALCYFLLPLYTLSCIPVTILGIMDKNKKYWNKTAHTRNITINEIKAS